MDSSLRQSLESIGQFSGQDLVLLERRLTYQPLKKNAFLLQQGQVCQSIFFLREGSCRRLLNRADGREETVSLYIENDWMADPASLTAQKPAETCIQACERGAGIELSLAAIHALIAEKPVFFQLGRLLDLLQPPTHASSYPGSVDEQYWHLLATRPQLIQKFPLKQIASFLKMTPETLSRIRSRHK